MNKIFFIAEAGKNFIDHDWKLGERSPAYYLANASRLAMEAKHAGADAIKFQTHVFDDEQFIRSENRYDWIDFNESITPYEEFWVKLRDNCEQIGIEFMTTPMSEMAAMKINGLVKRWKIGSGNVTDINLLNYIASTKKPVILSTGMSTQKQIETAIDILNNNELSLLYCESVYPCPVEELNLYTIGQMKNYFKVPIGFSDHTSEITTPAMASGMGAEIIEKHFTLSKKSVGPDHFFALEPDELKLSIDLAREYAEYKDRDFAILPSEKEIKLWKDFRKVAM